MPQLISKERYEEIKKATQEKITIDRPVRSIAKEYGVSLGSVAKIKRSKNFLDFKMPKVKEDLKSLGVSEDRIERLFKEELE